MKDRKHFVEKLIQKKEDCKKEDFVFLGHRKGKKIGKTCLSQWYEKDFEVDGHKYNCAEQYMKDRKHGFSKISKFSVKF